MRSTRGYDVGTGQVPQSHHGDGFRDSTMLSYWGSVIVEANTTGFAMEFIGDMNDSHSVSGGFMSHFSKTQHDGFRCQPSVVDVL